MRTSTLFLLLCASLGLGQVHFPFTRHDGRLAGISARDGDTVDLYGGQNTYMVNVTVGTPPQNVSLVLSSSSPHTWVPDGGSFYCKERKNYCKWGSFNKNTSSTFTLNSTSKAFDTDYVDGTFASGSWFTDTLRLGSIQVGNLSMGLADSAPARSWMGVLGIGFNDSKYSNLPYQLAWQGKIKSPAYSIWLDDPAAKSGNLLFGAVDQSKFQGNLRRIESYKYSPTYLNVGVLMHSLTIGGTNISSTVLPFEMSLSPPDSVSILPNDLAKQVWKLANATYYMDRAVIPCVANKSSSLTISLMLRGPGGPVIDVPMSDLVLPPSVWSIEGLYDINRDKNDTTEYCLFGIQNTTVTYRSGSYSGDGAYTIGSTLLRRTYTVFDLENQEVAVAPVKFDATDSKVVSFAAYGSKTPGATKYCEPDDEWCGRKEDEDAQAQAGSSSARALGPAAIAIGVGLGVVVLGAAAATTLICTRRGRCGEARPVGRKDDGASVSTNEEMTQTGTGNPVAAPAVMAGSRNSPVTPVSAPTHAQAPVSPAAETPDEDPRTSRVATPASALATQSPEPEMVRVSPMSTTEDRGQASSGTAYRYM